MSIVVTSFDPVMTVSVFPIGVSSELPLTKAIGKSKITRSEKMKGRANIRLMIFISLFPYSSNDSMKSSILFVFSSSRSFSIAKSIS